jgi:hypothetical protein
MALLLQFQPTRAVTVPVKGGAINRSGGSFEEGDVRETFAPTGWCILESLYRSRKETQIFVRSTVFVISHLTMPRSVNLTRGAARNSMQHPAGNPLSHNPRKRFGEDFLNDEMSASE